MAGDLGLPGAFGAQAFGDSLDRAWQERFQAAQVVAALRQKQQALDQGEALKRLSISSLVQNRQALDAARADANRTREEAQAEKQFNLTPIGSLVPMAQQQDFVKRGIPSTLFQPQPTNAPAPPESLTSGDQSDQPLPGTVANSPQPLSRGFVRIATQPELTKQAEDAQKASYQNDLTDVRSRLADVAEGRANTAQQLADIRQQVADQGKPDHFQLQPELDPTTGNPTGHFFGYNTATNRFTPTPGVTPTATKTPPGAGQLAQREAAKSDARNSLDQLDQAIEAAKTHLGPGPGRVSSIQQLIGNSDPTIQALGTKMLLTKMQVDHAATGTVRAGASPQLLARWDNLLAQKVTPEGLHASVQAMREILGGAANPVSSGVRVVSITPVK